MSFADLKQTHKLVIIAMQNGQRLKYSDQIDSYYLTNGTTLVYTDKTVVTDLLNQGFLRQNSDELILTV